MNRNVANRIRNTQKKIAKEARMSTWEHHPTMVNQEHCQKELHPHHHVPHMITSQKKTSRTKIKQSQGSNVKLWQCWQSCKCQKMPLKQLGNNLWHKFLAPQSVWNMFAIIVSFLVTDKQNPTAWEEIISPCFACVEQLKKVLGLFFSKQTSISYFLSHW